MASPFADGRARDQRPGPPAVPSRGAVPLALVCPGGVGLEGRHGGGADATSNRRGALGAVALLLAAGRSRCLRAGAPSSGQPAFTTSEAPGGAATAGQRVIALTFDDGPGPFTPQVLSVLERYQVPATFFEIGDEVARYPQYSKMVAAAGFPVEDHTWSHPDLTTLPASGVAAQIDMTQAEIQAVTGTTPQCVRPPYDAWNAAVLSQIAARGLTTMSYSVDPKDWTLPGVQAIADRVVGAAFPGAVVDMHDAGGDRSQTVAALPQIITRLRAMGYSFVSICGAGPTSGPQVSATYAFGDAPAPGPPVTSNLPLVGAAAADGGGYWEVAADGGIFSFGDAVFHGSMGGTPLNAAHRGHGGDGRRRRVLGGGGRRRDLLLRGRRLPRVDGRQAARTSPSWAWRRRPTVAGTGRWRPTAGSSPSGTPSSTGRWAASRSTQPIVGMAATADGGGYWEVAADGGIFSFGDAVFHGSMGGKPLNEPIVGMAAADGGGYWEVASDGGVFGLGAPFYGSRSGVAGRRPLLRHGADPGGAGYLLAGQHPAA